jgi:uncharacterized membrane protein YhiD involved in acid resistance
VWVTAALGFACGLAAWTIDGVALVIALILLVALGWMEGVHSKELKPSLPRNRNSNPKNTARLSRAIRLSVLGQGWAGSGL